MPPRDMSKSVPTGISYSILLPGMLVFVFVVNSIAHVQQAALRIPMRFGIGWHAAGFILLETCHVRVAPRAVPIDRVQRDTRIFQ